MSASPGSPEILFTCGRELAYPRNAMLLALLRAAYPTRALTSESRRMGVRYASVLARFLAQGGSRRAAALVVGFLGQPLVPVLRLFWKKPILFDAFISLYDTICFDRRWASPRSPVGRAARLLDQVSCALADRVLLDTQAHADYFQRELGIPAEKLRVLPVGSDEALFHPRPEIPEQPGEVLFYGSYLPLHGVDVIIRAAALLMDTPARFRLIGEGLRKGQVLALASSLGVTNVDFLPSVPLARLPEAIVRAGVCLGGPFGATEKAARVIAGKTYQCIAMGKATIVGDSPANRELLTHGVDAWLCPMNDPAALASAIRYLLGAPDVRARLGAGALRAFHEKAGTPVLKARMKEMMEELLSAGASAR